MGRDERSSSCSNNLPPGFRFMPSDEELIVHFLYHKAAHLPYQPDTIPTLDLHSFDPWDLDGKALQSGNNWYFFSPNTGGAEASSNGYWNPVDVDEMITSGGRIVGTKKTQVYHLSEGIKTSWVMQEYHLLDGVVGLSSSSSSSSSGSSSKQRSSSRKRSQRKTELDKWVIRRVYEAISSGPQANFCDSTTELSCLDEIFWSLDDLDEISLPY